MFHPESARKETPARLVCYNVQEDPFVVCPTDSVCTSGQRSVACRGYSRVAAGDGKSRRKTIVTTTKFRQCNKNSPLLQEMLKTLPS
jgi:hypothetical protein